jgi:hypothetical protein
MYCIITALNGADWYTSWIVVSVSFTALAFWPYVRNLWKAEDELSPTISGWFSWMLSDATIFAAQFWKAYKAADYSGVGFQTLLYVLSMRKGVLLAKRKGKRFLVRDLFIDWDYNDRGQRTSKDTICVAIVIAALVGWSQTNNELYAIGFTTISTVVGTFAIAWPLRLDPYRENLGAWLLFLAGGLAGIVAVKDSFYPFDVYNCFVNGYPPVLFLGVQLTLVYLTSRR